MNKLIMEYLVIEGYKSAAEEFSKEASVPPPLDLDTIERRMNIRDAVQRGDVEEAIERVNELNPEVCGPVTIPITSHLHQRESVWVARFPGCDPPPLVSPFFPF